MTGELYRRLVDSIGEAAVEAARAEAEAAPAFSPETFDALAVLFVAPPAVADGDVA